MNLLMLTYPAMTQLDLTGPLEVFSRCQQLMIQFVWKSTNPIQVSGGLTLVPSHSFENCATADILFIPGGAGQFELMRDTEVLKFIKRQAEQAHYITSVCTGSLILAAAGLLANYKATCHWLSLNQLSYFNVIPVNERVVIDGNRITGAGVTSGIDFALTLVALLFGEQQAKQIQLALEYDPDPPFNAGSIKHADSRTIEQVCQQTKGFQEKRETLVKKLAARLKYD